MLFAGFVVDLFKLGFGAICVLLVYFLLGGYTEVGRQFKCSSHSPWGSRCTLRAHGHHGQMHRDRRGRGWW